MAECQHMHAVPVPEPEAGTQGCEECLAIGQHATAHAHSTGHRVIRSFEPGEEWRYCYADEAFAE